MMSKLQREAVASQDEEEHEVTTIWIMGKIIDNNPTYVRVDM
jgi:hypothetical protein